MLRFADSEIENGVANSRKEQLAACCSKTMAVLLSAMFVLTMLQSYGILASMPPLRRTSLADGSLALKCRQRLFMQVA